MAAHQPEKAAEQEKQALDRGETDLPPDLLNEIMRMRHIVAFSNTERTNFANRKLRPNRWSKSTEE